MKASKRDLINKKFKTLIMKKLSALRYFLSVFLLLGIAHLSAQTVMGTVTDAANGEGLPGVNVLVKSTGQGTVTDLDGKYSVQATQGDVIQFTFVGFKTVESTVGVSATMDINMDEDALTLNEMVVTATRRPIRKIQATTAISAVSTAELKSKKPESFSEAIENTPGITINSAQGRKATFNIRGFPVGNGYVTTLIDGMPTSGTAGLTGSSPEFFGFDPNIERIEVVRGAAATLFGRSAGAGAVNIISKVGGEETKGSVSLTRYQNMAGEGHPFEGDFDYRADWNINGPLTENLRYNIGGYFLNDSGNKEQFAKDKGAQLRGNIDWLISDKSKVRFDFSFMNNEFQNITDAVWDPNTNSIPDNFGPEGTIFWDNEQLNFPTTVASRGTPFIDERTGGGIRINPGEFGEKVVGRSFGFDADLHLGNGWYFNQKLRVQKFDWNDINAFGFSGFLPSTGGSSFRFNAGAYQNVSDFISESRFTKEVTSGNINHNFNFGMFYSNGERDRLSFTYTFLANIDPRAQYSGFGPTLGTTSGVSGTTSNRNEKTLGLFIGDEMVINEKLSLNVALRIDRLNATFNTDPGYVRSIGIDLQRDDPQSINPTFSDWSGSIGGNYLTGENSALYFNFLRAFSLPSVTSLAAPDPDDPDYKNEIIQNLEVGYRAGLGDLTFDLGLFNTNINNRVALFFVEGVNAFIPQPAGSNKIFGAELDLVYAPSWAKGFLVRAGYTLQQSTYKDFLVQLSTSRATGMVNADLNNLFGLPTVGSGENIAIDVEGKQVQRTPRGVFNMNVSYRADRWGADFGGFTYSGINPDIFNLYEQPDLSVYNFGTYINFPIDDNELRFGIRIKNVLGGENPQELLLSSGNDSSLLERQAHPTGAGRLYWATIQNPRRLLMTLSYTF